MNAFGGVVFDELWGGVVGVDFDLVDSRNNLKRVNEGSLELGVSQLPCMMDR